MRNFTIYLAAALCLFLSELTAQESFESKAKAIALKIEQITKEEKDALKLEVEEVNSQLESGSISRDQADEQKLQLAEVRAKNIERRTAEVHDELRDLVQQKVDGKIQAVDTTKSYGKFFRLSIGERETTGCDTTGRKSERRTTTQFVFAAGVNNLVTNNSVAHSDYRYWGSHFYEWGFTWNSRIMKDHNLLHAKYGLSVMYNNLRPTDNRIFVENGNQTNLETSAIHLEDSRFRNVYIVVPLHLEFDFTRNKAGNGFRSHDGFRLGIGGYAGANVKSKQILKYENNGNDVRYRERGDFNVNDFIYGVSTYIGYGETSLYVKYDLNPLFAANAIKQNNISLGVRFDIN